MKDRLLQLLDLEQLSPSKFADIIGVQRSSVSHVISGRNKPSFDFLQKTLGAFPGLNASWLMMGEGTMYDQMGRTPSGNLFEPVDLAPEEQIPDNSQDADTDEKQIEASEGPEPEQQQVPQEPVSAAAAEAEAIAQTVASGSSKKIVQVMVIYEDDTFRAFSPAH